MNKKSIPILLASAALILGTGGFNAYRKTHQRLGTPGVKVTAQPMHDPDGNVVGTNSVALPARVLNYESEIQPVEKIVLSWLPKDTVYGQRHYRAPDGFQIAFNAVLMGADRTSIHKPKYCLTGTGWNIEKTEPGTLRIPAFGYDIPIATMTISRPVQLPSGATGTQRGFYVYWFVADNQLSNDHLQRMWWLARDLLRTGVLQRWAYLACLVACPPGHEESSYQRLTEFLQEAVPQFQHRRRE